MIAVTMLNTTAAPYQILSASAVGTLIGRHRDTARKLFDAGIIKTTVVAGRRVTTLAEVQRALGIGADGRIVASAKSNDDDDIG